MYVCRVDELRFVVVDVQGLLLIPVHLVIIQRVLCAFQGFGKVGPHLGPDQARIGAGQAAGGDDIPREEQDAGRARRAFVAGERQAGVRVEALLGDAPHVARLAAIPCTFNDADALGGGGPCSAQVLGRHGRVLGGQLGPLGHPEDLISAASGLLACVEGALAGGVVAVLNGEDAGRKAFLDGRPGSFQGFW